MKKQTIAGMLALGTMATAANAALWVDFNSTNQDGGPHNNAGYEAYDRGHEVEADVGVTGVRSQAYTTSFAVTGAASVTLTSDWTNTTDVRVRQSIDRAAGNDGNWTGSDLDLVTDFLGIDTRTGNGGNGDWDGTTGTPTYMTLALMGLPAGEYSWKSFHADTENVHVTFRVEIDTGAGFTQLTDGTMTDASPGGSPDSATDGSGLLATDFSPLNTYDTMFTADGTSDVTLRFAPYSVTPVHTQIWGINGFQLEQVPEPSAGLLGIFGAALLGLRRRR